MKRPPLCIGLALVLATYFPAPGNASGIPDTTRIDQAVTVEAHKNDLHRLLIAEQDPMADPVIVPRPDLPDTVLDKRAHAHTLLQKVLDSQRFLESLDALSEVELPVGVVKSGGAFDYTILIDRIQFTKEGALMDVYVSLALPQSETRLAFHGRVPLSAAGGISGNARVFLLGDHLIRFNNTTLVTIRGSEASYVEFDCSGFLGVNIDAELQFSTDMLIPEDEHGTPGGERLRISFTTYTQTLHDMLVSLEIPAFQIKGLPGFGFRASRAYVDWSDVSNPAGIAFRENYTSPVIEAGLSNLWQGIYLEEFEVRLPPAFAKRESVGRVSVGARQMIIDEQGLTGGLYAENIIQDGNMNGWTYSIDELSLELFTNHVAGFGIEGRLTIPVVKGRDGKNTDFRYVAQRSTEGDYIFSVKVETDLKLDLWVADIKLSSGSAVIVTERDKKFFPSAHLNGELSINISEKGPKTRFNSIRFEDMVINSEAPYFRPGTFGFGRQDHNSSISKYPVVFDNITLRSEDNRAGIAFDVIVNISGKAEDESFAGKANLVVWGIQDDEPLRDADGNIVSLDRFSWRFDGVELSALKINIKKPRVFELAGEIRFFDEDPIYGEGFKGSLKGSLHKISVEAHALFGKTEDFRYWYADALVELGTGIPIVPGVLSAFGFGGGYYSKMKQSSQPVDGTLGRSPSGIHYIPDENTVGIRAIVLIGTPRPEAMKGDVALELSLNRHGGINTVTFSGNANFMSTESLNADQIRQLASAAVAGKLTEKLGSLKRGQVYGSVRLHFDNVNDVFHGNLEIYVNVAGGIVRGVNAGNKAGWAVMHFEKNDWYIHIGTPDQPLGLEVARIFKSKSYFMLGKNLPGSPPPPPQVSEILGGVDLDYMRDLNALESGMGIAFGLHFLVDTGDLRFLMFYGRFSAGTGLDFMLKDYGNEYHCAGSSGPMGINGWYANGQAYAFVMGKIGIKVNLRFYKGTYDILSIGAAAILQAKGPNPFWMKGTVGGYYKILGGLVKGKCRFEVVVGKECKPIAEQNLLEEVNLIAGITPLDAATEVSVFNTPQVAFNIPIGEIFEITDMEQTTHSFRAVLEEFVVLDGPGLIKGERVWNDERNVVAFDPADLLPGEKKLRVRARLAFEEKLNGAWTKVRFGGKVITEIAEAAFETGKAPGTIPLSNIAYSYPLVNQHNFFTEEFDQGFIQLYDGQPYLFSPGKDWIQKVRFTETSTGEFLESDLAYNSRTRLITFRIPGGMRNTATYGLQIIDIPKTTVAVDANLRNVATNLQVDEAAGTATLNTQTLEGNMSQLEIRTIFSINFRTSRFRSFPEKMKHLALSPAIRLSSGINIFQLTARLNGDEYFDSRELPALSGARSLIRAEAILESNKWYERHVYPLIYEGYPIQGWMHVRRPVEHLGIPPVHDVYFKNLRKITDPTGSSSVPGFSNEYLVYNLGESVAADFYDLQRHAVNFIVDNPTQTTARLRALALQPMPYLRYGKYKIRFNYTIPGINKTTSSHDMEIFNRIPDND